jgi:hypothetical protein
MVKREGSSRIGRGGARRSHLILKAGKVVERQSAEGNHTAFIMSIYMVDHSTAP